MQLSLTRTAVAAVAFCVASGCLGTMNSARAEPGPPGTSTATTQPPPTATSVTPPTATSTVAPTTVAASTTTVVSDPTKPALQLEASSAPSVLGQGSSFAAPEVQQWEADTAKAPYNLDVNFTSSGSSAGRYSFTQKTDYFAVSDIRYQPFPYDTEQPKFPFQYVPVTAGGLAFMYNLKALPANQPLKLSSYSVCAVFTGGVGFWDDRIIQDDNPGVQLPHVAVHPVVSLPTNNTGTNFVFEEYCIFWQPGLWKAFTDSVRNKVAQVQDISATEPRSDYPLFDGSVKADGSVGMADTVSVPQDDGYVTAVETAYALQRHTPVASMKNASGQYVQPDEVGVASGLAYATQREDGTHDLHFDGAGPHVYNPSTYSYAVLPTDGSDPAKGAVLSRFFNYALTLGQKKATQIGYASLGLSLEKYGFNKIRAHVPGAVDLTADEQTALDSGDLTPQDVAQGQTHATPGKVNTNNITGANANNAGAANNARPAGAANGPGSVGGGGGASGIDASVSLGADGSLAKTGGEHGALALVAVALMVGGEVGRRRLRRRRP